MATIVLLVAGMPLAALAHPHIWISQHVRVVAKDGKFTHVEIEWRFDPISSEDEIPPIDEDGDGKISPQEAQSLEAEMLPELQKNGFLTWLNTGAKDFHPPKRPTLAVHIDDPASFTPADWNHDEGDKDSGMPMPPNKRVEPAPPRRQGPRNLVYVMRFALPEPVKAFSITTYEPEDFIRIEVDKASLPAGCTLAKHPTYKAEFVPGHPVFADKVSCRVR
ncbi:MAG: DUF1007 family protein [Reyranellales bacterium]